MDKDRLILLIDDNATGIDSIRRVLGDHLNHFRLRRVPDVPTALARILGGGVDIILMNIPAATNSDDQRLVPFRALQSKTRNVPVVLLCDSADESLGEAAIRDGAKDYLIREAYEVDLLRVLRSVAEKGSLTEVPARPASSGKGGRVLAFIGSKGGSGTTTVALNVAAALAEDHRVVLAEIRTELGTLMNYFQPHRSIRDIGDLVSAEDGVPGVQQAEACLWPCNNVPDLQVLFGARNLEDSGPLSSVNVRAILADLAESADYLVADLPVRLSEGNRAVIEDAALCVLVVERDSVSVEAAKLMLRAIDSWRAARVSMGLVIVNRSALVSPMSLAEIETQLPVPILAVIPPAADLCAAAQRAHMPVVALDADSLLAIALRSLARVISQQIPLVRSSEMTGAAGVLGRSSTHDMHRAGVR